jgi:hypothetical protein
VTPVVGAIPFGPVVAVRDLAHEHLLDILSIAAPALAETSRVHEPRGT